MADGADKPASLIRSTKLRRPKAKTSPRPRWTVLLRYRPGNGTEELVQIWTSKAWTEEVTSPEHAMAMAMWGTGRSEADLVVRENAC